MIKKHTTEDREIIIEQVKEYIQQKEWLAERIANLRKKYGITEKETKE